MTADLAQACNDLTAWLPALADLTPIPDRQPSAGRTQPASRPPWNAQAANAMLDIHAAARTIEADLRYVITGRLLVRGGSDSNTIAALQAIPRLAEAVDTDMADDAMRLLERLLTAVMVLPAVDLEERPRRILAPCPYCKYRMLLAWPAQKKVTCTRRKLCFDRDGNHPVGQMVQGAVSGQDLIAWSDGLVT